MYKIRPNWVAMDIDISDFCEKVAENGGEQAGYVIEKLFMMLQSFQKRDCICALSDDLKKNLFERLQEEYGSR